MGIYWDGSRYDIHHINFDHEDNRIENLILLPKDVHQKLHGLLRTVNMNWDETIRDYVIDAFMYGSCGDYLQSLEWFNEYAKIVFDLSLWGFMKKTKYRKESGALIEVEGIHKYGR